MKQIIVEKFGFVATCDDCHTSIRFYCL